MAPELLTSDICNKEADIWALGCILYEIMFKKSPFFDNS
jgi:serine/threonine protein kinase